MGLSHPSLAPWRPAVVFLMHLAMGIVCLTGSASSLRCGKALSYDHSEFFSCPRPFDHPDAVYCCNPGTKDSYCCSMPNQDLDHLGKREHSKSSLSSDSVSSSFNTNSNNEHQHIVYVKSSNHNIVDDKQGGFVEDNSVEDRSTNPYSPPPLDDSRAEKRSIVGGLAKLVGIIIGVVIFVLILCVVCCCCCPFCLVAKKRSRGEIIRQFDASVPPQQPQSQGGYPANPNVGYPPPQQQPSYPPQGYPSQPYAGYSSQPGAFVPQNSYPGYSTQQPAGYPQQGYPPPDQPGAMPQYPAQPPPYPGMEASHSQPQMTSEMYQTQPSYNVNY